MGKENQVSQGLWLALFAAAALAFFLLYPWDQAGPRRVSDLPLERVFARNPDKSEAAHHAGITAASMEEFHYLLAADAASEKPKYDTNWKIHELRVKVTSAFMQSVQTKEKYPDHPPPGLADTLSKFLSKRIPKDAGKLKAATREQWLTAALDIAAAARYAQSQLGG